MEKKEIITEKTALYILARLLRQSDKGISHIITSYLNCKSSEDIRRMISDNIQISLDSLGRRFNSLFNIDTEAKRKLSFFLKNDAGAEILNKRKLEIVDELKDLRFRSDKDLRDVINQIIKTITELPSVNGKNICEALSWKDDFDKSILSDM